MWWILLIVVGIPVMGVVSIPLMMIWTHHRRQMEEMALQRQKAMTEDVRAEFAALRAEIKSLRDTAMQYDLSFDTNMQHLDRRVGQLERQTIARASGDTGVTQNLYNGR
jgi:hypothetical protein